MISNFLLIIFLKKIFSRNFRFYISKSDLIFVLFLIYNFFIGILSNNKIYFSFQFLNICFLFLFYVAIKGDKLNYKNIFRTILILLSVIAILGKYDFIPEFSRFSKTPKPYIPLGNPDYIGSLIIILLPFVIFDFKNKISLFISALSLFSLYITYCESAYFGITMAILFYLFFKKRKYFLTVFIIFIIIFIFFSLRFDYNEPLNLRKVYYTIGFDIFKNHPFGIGLGNLRSFYPIYHLKHLIRHSYPFKVHIPLRIHNEYLQILIESGFIGFLLFIISAIFFIKNIDFKKTDISVLMSLIAIGFQSLFFFPLHRPVILLIVFFLLSRIKQKKEILINIRIIKGLKYSFSILLIIVYFNYLFLFLSDIYFYKGIKYFENKEFNKAELVLNKAYKLYPEPEISFYKARVFFNTEKIEKALKVYKKIESLVPGPYLFYNIGLCFYYLKDFESAKKYFLSSYVMDKDLKIAFNLYKECLK